ncbi:MAG: hypothetical protein LBJ14_00560 [Desulfarculales bacterium]|jgi:hypothetical protein|nr:hypothetical protein [Desulfarculales bacterium]
MTSFYRPNPECKMPVCTKTSVGQLVLPSTNCHCVQDFGPGRMSLPPVIWFGLGLGILAYIWLNNLSLIGLAWRNGGWNEMAALLTDLSNLLLALTLFSLIMLWGGIYELRKRRQELASRRPFLLCELKRDE